jgi:hypothetical protein
MYCLASDVLIDIIFSKRLSHFIYWLSLKFVKKHSPTRYGAHGNESQAFCVSVMLEFLNFI